MVRFGMLTESLGGRMQEDISNMLCVLFPAAVQLLSAAVYGNVLKEVSCLLSSPKIGINTTSW